MGWILTRTNRGDLWRVCTLNHYNGLETETHQGTFVFYMYSNVLSTPVAIYLCQSDTGVLKVPR